MIKFSANSFISTLINIITGSPTSILFIILGLIFTIAMIINVKKNKTIGKSLFIIGWIFIVLFIIIKYNSYISKLFDNLINNVFMQIFFPNLATYIIIIVITNIIFLRTIMNKNSKIFEKITNSIFFSIIMVLMIYTLDLIIANKVNIYSQKELYTNEQILTLIESTTIIFSLWLLILFSKYTIKKLITKSDNKIKEEFEEKEKKSNIVNLDTKYAQNINPTSVIPEQPIQNINSTPVIPEQPIQNINSTPVIPEQPIQNINPTPVISEQPIQNINPTPVIPEQPIQNINPTPVIPEQHVQNINPTPVIPEQPIKNINPTPVIPEQHVQNPNIFSLNSNNIPKTKIIEPKIIDLSKYNIERNKLNKIKIIKPRIIDLSKYHTKTVNNQSIKIIKPRIIYPSKQIETLEI